MADSKKNNPLMMIFLLILIVCSVLGAVAFIMQFTNTKCNYESNPERQSNDNGDMTQNFFMCASSQVTYDKLKDKKVKYTFAQMEDMLLGIERESICNYRSKGTLPSSNTCKEAKGLSESIKKLTGKDLDYHAIHLKAICTPNDHTAPSKHISDEKLCRY